jgi:hypothetical protein
MKMHYLKNNEINKELYNICIDSSPIPKVYAYAWYLDEMCGGSWDAIVNDDYSIVFPLPFAYKLGALRYINPPPFIQQLGIFGMITNSDDIRECIDALPFNFIVLRQHFNTTNQIQKPFKILENFQLNLVDYNKIFSNYNKDLKNNLKKIQFEKVFIDTHADLDLTIHHFKENYPTINDNRYTLFKNAALQAIKLGNGTNYGFYLDGQPLAFAFFLHNHKYVHYMMPGPTALGRKYSIIQSMLDFIIKSNCSKGLTFDFEGSSYPNVALLYKKFNPYSEFYYLKNIWLTQLLCHKITTTLKLQTKKW